MPVPKPAQPGCPRQPNYECPECGFRMAPQKIHSHTASCAAWLSKWGEPYPYFSSGSPAYVYGPEALEGVDFVRCLVCAEHGWEFCFRRMMQHIQNDHALSEDEYVARYPGGLVRLPRTAQKRKETAQARYGVDNVFQLESVKEKSKETLLLKYGVENTNLIPESRALRARTNLERYGAENPFGSPEVQVKLRETMVERYGAENPQQVPEIQTRTRETNLQRYGAEHYVSTPEYRAKFEETSLERYGEKNPMQSEEGRKRWEESCLAKYGVRNPLALREIQAKSQATNRANHGGKHSQSCPEVRAKARETWLEKYGVDNPSKSEAIKAKIKDVWMGKYGVPFPPQSLWTNRMACFPNNLEKKVDRLSPECVVYSGDGTYWIRHQGASKARNPDFVVLRREQLALYLKGAALNDLRVSAVVEVFGDYWHGPTQTGKSRILHKIEVERYYALCGVCCLILWEWEILKDPAQAARRIRKFLSQWRRGALKEKDTSMSVFDLFTVS